MQKFVARFVKDELGATAIEYGLIAALIAVGIIGCRPLAGRRDRHHLHAVTTELGGRQLTRGSRVRAVLIIEAACVERAASCLLPPLAFLSAT